VPMFNMPDIVPGSWNDDEVLDASQKLISIFGVDLPYSPKFAPEIVQAIQWGKKFLHAVLVALAVGASERQRLIKKGLVGGAWRYLEEGNKIIPEYCHFDAREEVDEAGKVSIVTRERVSIPSLGNGTIGPFLKAIIADNIITAFDSNTGANGLYYIGACPRCLKMFLKPRGDSVYCGKYCATEGTRKKIYITTCRVM